MIPPSWSGRSAGTGASRTPCTGFSTSPSMRMTAGCATAPPPATSPSCARSLSISSPETTAAKPASAAGARKPPGTTTTCSRSSPTRLMREPWPAAKSPYAGHRFPAEIISHAVWLYFRFPLSLRMVEELLAARGIVVSHETVRQWALKFGQEFANRIRRRLPQAGDKWHLDEVAIKIAGVQHWLWRAVDQNGMVLDVLVQSRRDKPAAKRLLRKLLKRQCRAPRVMVTDKLPSYGAAKKDLL